MKKLIKKALRIKAKQKQVISKNYYVGPEVLTNIKTWENQKNELIIRSNFNRELYYKYLETTKNITR